MKILSWNIDLFNCKAREVVELILEEDPDIVCLQEVSNGLQQEVHREFKAKEILDHNLDVIYRFKFYAPFYETYPYEVNGEKKDFGGLIQSGNYLLSKKEFKSAESIFNYQNYSQIRDWQFRAKGDTPKAFEAVKLRLGLKDLTVINFHGKFVEGRMGDENTMKACEILLDYSEKQGGPLVITGDFNLHPESDSLKILTNKYKELVIMAKIPSTRPHKEEITDYIFVSEDIFVEEFRVIKSNISDNYPLVLEFEV